MNMSAFLADPQPWMVIALMAAVTALTRFSGFWLLGSRALSPRAKSVLAAVPASVLTSIVAPTVLLTGLPETVAAIVTVLVAWRLPTLAAMAAGVVCVVVLRNFTGL